MKKKVLINIPNFKLPGAGGVSALYRALELNKIDNIEYFVLHGDKREKNPFLKLLRLVQKFLEFFFKVKKYDISVLNPSLDKNSFFRDLVFLSLAKLRKKKVILFWHGWNENFEQQIKDSSIKHWLFKKTFAKVNSYIVLGTIFQEKLIKLGVNPAKKFFLFANAADDKYLQDTTINRQISFKKKINLLFLSRIEKAKGVYTAIDAFILLANRVTTPLELTIAGDGPELNNAKKYVQEKSLININFTGRIIDEEKHKALLDADIFLFPTQYGEGLPLCILEAMLYGLPVLTRPVGGIPDIFSEGENGFLIQSSNPADFTLKLEELINNHDLYNKIATNNFKKGQENFTVDKAKQKYLDIVLTDQI